MKKDENVEIVRCEDCTYDTDCPVRHWYCSSGCLKTQKRKEEAKE